MRPKARKSNSLRNMLWPDGRIELEGAAEDASPQGRLTRVAHAGREGQWHVGDYGLLLYFCILFAHQDNEAYFNSLTYIALGLCVVLFAIDELRKDVQLFTRQVLWPLIWLVLFWTYALLSSIWAMYASYQTGRLFALHAIIALVVITGYIRNCNDLTRILTIIVIALAYSAVLLIVLTPFQDWGKVRVGEYINVQTNALGMRLAFGSAISFFIYEETRNKRFLLPMSAFALISLFTFSRKAFIVLLLFYSTYYFLRARGAKKLVVPILIVAAMMGVLYVVMTNDLLFHMIGSRMQELFAATSSADAQDASSIERQCYRDYAIKMWIERPLFGWGLNNFEAMMAYIGYPHVAYSHCNYTELLSCLGVFGFIAYYAVYGYLFYEAYRFRNAGHERCIPFLVAMLVAMLVIDYGYVALYNFDNYIRIAILCGMINMFYLSPNANA